MKTINTTTKKFGNLNRSVWIAFVIGGILLSSNEGWAQKHGKKPPVKEVHRPAVKAPPKAVKGLVKVKKIVRTPGSRKRLTIRKGKWAGITLLTLSSYNNYGAFSRLPVEVAVQTELQYLGHYHGPIDGQIGQGSVRAILSYQRANGLVATGNIDRALLKSLNIID